MKMDRLKLQEKINEWVNEDETRDFYVGQETTELMAKAAFAVIEAVQEAQKSAIREGYLTE
jgi:hypothetical protein